MKIAVDLDDTLSVVDRVTRAQGYIERMGLPFKLRNRYSHALAEVFDWELADVLEFVHAGGITVFTDAEARRGAREALAAFKAAGHTVTVLTARTKEWFVNPETVSRDWLEKRHIPHDGIVAGVSDKGTWCVENGYGVLIDDYAETCLSAQELGVNAILFTDRSNISRAHEIRYAAGTWKEIEKTVERIALAQRRP